jgi:hypothetical protein
MRNGLTTQVVPETIVDFSGPHPRAVAGRLYSVAERDRAREIAAVLDTISVAAGNGDVDATLAAAARLASLRNRSPRAQQHYSDERRHLESLAS